MQLESVTIQNFRCFGPSSQPISISDGTTVIVGANGCGKTAFLEALLRLFGVTGEQRAIRRSDFHFPPETTLEDRSSRSLSIDARFRFPELRASEEASFSVPPCFNHMTVQGPDGRLFCRIRLEATWTDDGTEDGSIDSQIWWITSDDPSPDEDHKVRVAPYERGLIQVHYVPASRDASSQLSYASNAMIGRLLRVLAWSPQTRADIQKASEDMRSAFNGEIGVKALNQALSGRWRDLYDATYDADPELTVVGSKFSEIIRRPSVVFRPTESGGERDLEVLSEGQKSLFYFSLVATVFEIEERLRRLALRSQSASQDEDPSKRLDRAGREDSTGFQVELLRMPILTIFALEEPENHLVPFFLARIMRQVRLIVGRPTAQAVITSHSPAILSRVEPAEVRHFRLDSPSQTSVVNEINLPEPPSDAAKYVREAVIAYPELYFARFVILAEGPSEQIVLPRLAAALNYEIDPSFVAVVPLGGRHVNHFWKLLSGLSIPHVTLLDLDRAREGGCWGRIKYACDQLLEIGLSRERVLMPAGAAVALSDGDFAGMTEWDIADDARLQIWLDHLETLGVFFSAPLDLDMSMLRSFREAYQGTVENGYGPRLPKSGSAKCDETLNGAVEAVFGSKSDALGLYDKSFHDLFFWYRYLFLGKGKPSTHLLALSQIDNASLAADAPAVLRRLLECVATRLKRSASGIE